MATTRRKRRGKGDIFWCVASESAACTNLAAGCVTSTPNNICSHLHVVKVLAASKFYFDCCRPD